MGLNQMVYAIDKKQLGFQHGRCICGSLMGFHRGEMVVRSLTAQRVIRYENVDIAEIRRRFEERASFRAIPLRVDNWMYGGDSAIDLFELRSQAGAPTPLPIIGTGGRGRNRNPEEERHVISDGEVEELIGRHAILNLGRTEPDQLQGRTISQAVTQNRPHNWVCGGDAGDVDIATRPVPKKAERVIISRHVKREEYKRRENQKEWIWLMQVHLAGGMKFGKDKMKETRKRHKNVLGETDGRGVAEC